MKPHSHSRLKYLCRFIWYDDAGLIFFVVHNFYYSCFFLSPLIHVLALLSITSFVRLVLVLYVAMTLSYGYQD